MASKSSKKAWVKGLSSHPILQSGTERTYYVTWDGAKGHNVKDHVSKYEVQWGYNTGTNKPWFNESVSSTTTKTSTYNAPNNAAKIHVRVRPISKTYKGNDKKTHNYFTAAWSNWKKLTVLRAGQSVRGTVEVGNAFIDISPVGSSTANVKASWLWPARKAGSSDVAAGMYLADHVAGYEYTWEYSVDDTGEKDWLSGTEGTTTNKAITYSIPNDATYIRFRIRPFAESTETGNPYWEANTSAWEVLKVSSLAANIPTKPAITGVELGLQSGTSDTLYAAWDWDIDNTENFEFEWQYYTGDASDGSPIYFEGSSGSTELQNTTYQIPQNATVVQFHVKAVAETNSDGGGDTDYWKSEYSEWVKIRVAGLIPKVPTYKPIKDPSVALQVQSERVLMATWNWVSPVKDNYGNDTTKEYQYAWQYTTANQKPYNWSEPTTGTATVKNCTYNIPNNATFVMFRVRAVAKTHTVSGQETEWWRTSYSSAAIVKIASLIKNVPKKTKPTEPTLALQSGTADTLYATWVWTEPNTDSYEIEWEYHTGDQWFSGESQTTGKSQKTATYSVPENAIQVRCRVHPISETRTIAGEEVDYWYTDYSSWAKVKMSDFEPKVPSIATLTNASIGQQEGSDDTIYAVWTWTKEFTGKYEYQWQYRTADGSPGHPIVWYDGTSGETADQSVKNCTYTFPNNALAARIRIKPIARTRQVNGKDYEYWTTGFSSWFTFSKNSLLPKTPSVPTVTIDGLTLTASVDVYNNTATSIEFDIVADDKTRVGTGQALIVTNHAEFVFNVAAGHEYKVRCRGVTNELQSGWSEYSSSVGTAPSGISEINYKKSLSTTSMRVGWTEVANADSYTVEYATDPEYFDASSEVKSTTVNVPYAILTGLDTGMTWYVRVRSSNENGDSGWSSITSLVLGKTPSPPTTWSETTTATVGSDVILYWVHNSEDDSRQTEAVIELTIGGSTSTVALDMTSEDEGAVDQISSYTFETSGYSEGATLQWRVKTRGIMDEFSDWSVERLVDIYAVPTLIMGIEDMNGTVTDELTALPMTVTLEAGPMSQDAIGYSLSFIANDSYESLDDSGRSIYISKGSTVYSEYFTSDTSDPNNIAIEITAGEIDLEIGATYVVYAIAAFNSGLTSEVSRTILVNWEEEDETYDLYPDAEIGIDEENICAFIRPYCENEDGELVENVELSVFRRNFDGDLVEIVTGLSNDGTVTVMDPHPGLDYARYRIIAMSTVTGRSFYYDAPGVELGINSIVIQWGEGVTRNEDEDGYFEAPPVSGTVLRLPYNVDVQDSFAQDVNLVKYIGRSHPVSYYGTQLGSTSSWNTDVPADDTETIYALRTLAVYMGDVYVREPSGSGYWAQVNVSFNRTHDSTVVPVTLEINRVEGGA